MSRCFKIVVGAWAGLLLMGGVALIAEKQDTRPQTAMERIEQRVKERVTSPEAQARLAETMRASQERGVAAQRKVSEAEEKLRLALERERALR